MKNLITFLTRATEQEIIELIRLMEAAAQNHSQITYLLKRYEQHNIQSA